MHRIILSIRHVLQGLGAFSMVVAAALAGFGLLGIHVQRAGFEHVALLQEAVQNHVTADAFMDDMRTDALRALQRSAGANKETAAAILEDLQHHAKTVRNSVSANLVLALDPELHRQYGLADAQMAPFSTAAVAATELALNDEAAGAANYEHFRQDFTSFETLMDDIRDNLEATLARARTETAAAAAQSERVIVGAMLAGLLVLLATATVAVRAADRITAALACSQAKANHLSLHDGLTGLPNRTLLAERVAATLVNVRRYGHSLAMLCLDLDRFKHVNDTLGHSVGDVLLQSVAQRLLENVREGDIVARLGGDEFVVVQASIANADEAGVLAQRLVEVLSEPYHLEGHQVVVGASIGVALAPGDSGFGAELLKMADMALYRAKSDGRGTFRFFEQGMDAKLQARRSLEADLREAVAGEKLTLNYQPLLNLRSGTIAGFEALARWHHPERGHVSPGDFIPLAEETGLIVPIGAWVLREACLEAVRWPGDVCVAVNVSAVQFKQPGLLAAVSDALAESGLAPGRLELEITETALIADGESTLAVLRELQRLGVRIAMDDFGTGYSSLSYLRSFPFDKIKIDQCFVRDIETNGDCTAIVRAVAGLGVNLGITTTAEGVETFEQFEMVRTEGCHLVQGYYFSRPVSAAETMGLLRTDWSSKLVQAPEKAALAFDPLAAVLDRSHEVLLAAP